MMTSLYKTQSKLKFDSRDILIYIFHRERVVSRRKNLFDT